MASLNEFWLSLRNRLLMDPRFQNAAAATPVVRGIARRKARGVFDLCSGFIYSQVLLPRYGSILAAARSRAPAARDHRRAHRACRPNRPRRLLDAAVSLDLTCKLNDGRFGLGMNGAAAARQSRHRGDGRA